jgi:glycosyltransferase involved in cell wall biosynthesis
VVGRIAAAQAKIPKVIYMAHGFHFWKGAPLKNWLCYYPVERLMAHYTDRLITLNYEDYERAKHFHYKKGGHAEYVPGVGIVTDRFQRNDTIRTEMRKELGITDNQVVLLSVGEVNKNKNHKVVIEALSRLEQKNICYIICGIGDQAEPDKRLAKSLGLQNRVVFAGFRADVDHFYQAADLFVIPSFREGLPVSLMEAMSAGLPCIASRIRGNVDLMEGSQLLFSPHSAAELCSALNLALNENIAKKEIARNTQALQKFTVEEATKAMKRIYQSVIGELQATEDNNSSGNFI